jgi:hypothetical protein
MRAGQGRAGMRAGASKGRDEGRGGDEGRGRGWDEGRAGAGKAG